MQKNVVYILVFCATYYIDYSKLINLYILNFRFIRDAEVIDLKRQVQSHQETIGKLHSEREDLMQKIQAGEGTNAALQQLQDQNVS